MRPRMVAKRLREPFPEVLARGRIVEQVAGAQDRVHAVASADDRGSCEITSIRARDSFFCASSGNDGNRRPRCQSAVWRSPQHDVSGRRRDPERHLEQPGHRRRPVPKLVIFVSPFPIDLVFPGIERADAALERLVLLGQAQDLRFDPVSRGGADDLVAPSPSPRAASRRCSHARGGRPGPCRRRTVRADRWPARSASARASRPPVGRRTRPRPPHRPSNCASTVDRRTAQPSAACSRSDLSGQRWIESDVAVDDRRLPPAVEPARSRRSRPAQPPERQSFPPAHSAPAPRQAGATIRPSRPTTRGRPQSPRGPADAGDSTAAHRRALARHRSRSAARRRSRRRQLGARLRRRTPLDQPARSARSRSPRDRR